MPLYIVLNAQRRLQTFRPTTLGSRYQEQDLENWIEQNPQVLLQDEPMLVVGRQVTTPVGIVDLLGLDSSGAGVVIELKRAPTQREVVAQALEYASWLSVQGSDELQDIAEDYLRKKQPSQALAEAWQETFGTQLDQASLNREQRVFILIEGQDERITSVAQFLRNSGVDISLLSYSFYQTESGEEILSIEMHVGSTEDAATAGARPSEAALLRGWDAAAVDAYEAFKTALLAQGLFLKPQKSGMSFIKQTPRAPVFVCFFYATGPQVGIWLRSDSLSSLFDFQSAADRMRQRLPAHVRVRHTPTWFIMSLPASRADSQQIAGILLTEVVTHLE